MANLFRRAGSYIAKIHQSASDPAAVAGQAQLYAKDSGGVTKLFTRDGAGTIAEIGAGGSQIVASTVLGSPASTMSVSGLDGDADGEYDVEFNYIASGTAAHNVDIRPNGDTGANRPASRRFATTMGSSTTGIIIANGGPLAGAVHHRSTIRCWAKRVGNYYRRFEMDGIHTWDSGTQVAGWESWVVYGDDTVNLTSLTLGITTVQFATGSELIVRKVVR